MSGPALQLVLLNFGGVGLLTAVLLRKISRLGVRWWATSFSFMLCPAFLVCAAIAGLPPLMPAGWAAPLSLAAVVFSAGSIALMFLTLGTHRIPLALWHQDNDKPSRIVTYGAYSRIRHPFYTSYILAFLAALAVFPQWGTLCLLVYMIAALNLTAAGEERRLSASAFGEEYRQYIARTGRFVPRLRSRYGQRAPVAVTHEPGEVPARPQPETR